MHQDIGRMAASLRSISRSLDRLVALEVAKASGNEDAVHDVIDRLVGRTDERPSS
jgi:hypothetical protein